MSLVVVVASTIVSPRSNRAERMAVKIFAHNSMRRHHRRERDSIMDHDGEGGGGGDEWKVKKKGLERIDYREQYWNH